MFLTLMVIGLVGLVAMAIPAFGHGRGALSGHGAAHGIGHGAHGMAHASAAPSASVSGARAVLQQLLPADAVQHGFWRWVPSPRKVFSLLALYGAFGNAAVHALKFSPQLAAFSALVPALAIEWLLLRPLWNMLFRVQAAPCSPLEQLVASEACAVLPFRNGRGMVSAVRDGRSVQLVAYLRQDQHFLPVKVGDRLLIESVDAVRERVTVSFFPG